LDGGVCTRNIKNQHKFNICNIKNQLLQHQKYVEIFSCCTEHSKSSETSQ
jgi:hypothetical protein